MVVWGVPEDIRHDALVKLTTQGPTAQSLGKK